MVGDGECVVMLRHRSRPLRDVATFIDYGKSRQGGTKAPFHRGKKRQQCAQFNAITGAHVFLEGLLLASLDS
jgi:hypothetical protein